MHNLLNVTESWPCFQDNHWLSMDSEGSIKWVNDFCCWQHFLVWSGQLARRTYWVINFGWWQHDCISRDSIRGDLYELSSWHVFWLYNWELTMLPRQSLIVYGFWGIYHVSQCWQHFLVWSGHWPVGHIESSTSVGGNMIEKCNCGWRNSKYLLSFIMDYQQSSIW